MLREKKRLLLSIIIAVTSLSSLPAKATCTLEGYINFVFANSASNRIFVMPSALSPGFAYGDFTNDDMMSFAMSAQQAKTRVLAIFDIATCPPGDLGTGSNNLGNLTFIRTDPD